MMSTVSGWEAVILANYRGKLKEIYNFNQFFAAAASGNGCYPLICFLNVNIEIL